MNLERDEARNTRCCERHEDMKIEIKIKKKDEAKREHYIDVWMIGVESLERDHGGYKYLYYESEYMH